MAETLNAVRPSMVGYNKLVTSTQNPIRNLFDTNDENYAYTVSNSNVAAVLHGFDFSSVPDNATIKSISVTIKGEAASNSQVTMSAQLVKDASTTTNTFTDLGDGLKQFYKGTALTTTTLDYPIAASVCTVDFLKNDGLQLRLFQNSGPHFVYAVYISVTYEVPVTYTLTVAAGAGGTVTGGGVYEAGTNATLTATPNTGYKFKQWSDGNTNATRTVTVTGNATYTATFEKVATSNTFRGTSRQTVYGGISKQSVYIGTKKIT